RFPAEFQIEAHGMDGTVPHALAERLRERPEVASVAESRGAEARVGGEETWVAALSAQALGTIMKPEMTEGTLDAASRPGTAMVDAETARLSGHEVG
ncbi:hypothetical protein JYB64_25465, partial [Algoriphagus aestuarii]|nr:hypothetical protein [Algoriphagus aestuarii]